MSNETQQTCSKCNGENGQHGVIMEITSDEHGNPVMKLVTCTG
ncbi:hypothetical protein [Streptomyces spirodelae]|nr:hypothetical protein [Streptomyces spirodelae]